MPSPEQQPREEGVLLRRVGYGGFLGAVILGSLAEVRGVITPGQFLAVYGVATGVGIATAISEYRAGKPTEHMNTAKVSDETGQQRSPVVESISYAQAPDASPVNA